MCYACENNNFVEREDLRVKDFMGRVPCIQCTSPDAMMKIMIDEMGGLVHSMHEPRCDDDDNERARGTQSPTGSILRGRHRHPELTFTPDANH